MLDNDGYFSNVAAASGATTNVYAVDTQYYDSTSTRIKYSESFGSSGSHAYWDSSTPSNDCGSNWTGYSAGGTTSCVTDTELQNEVSSVIKAKGWPTGLNAEYFVFLGNGISDCYSSSSCAFTQWCAYHSSFSSGSGTVLYANMPFTGHNTSACGAPYSPTGDNNADSTINVTSHEENETITDPLGSAWYDAQGNEIGDKCAWNFGSDNGGYNQTINGQKYILQQEWSNANSGCELS